MVKGKGGNESAEGGVSYVHDKKQRTEDGALRDTPHCRRRCMEGRESVISLHLTRKERQLRTEIPKDTEPR